MKKFHVKQCVAEHHPALNNKNNLETGKLGEKIAKMFLVKRGFSCFEANFRKKCGEIDIVAHETSSGTLWFFEVKTMSVRSLDPDIVPGGVGEVGFRPEERVDNRKLSRLYKTIYLYLAERRVSQETPWRLGVISVLLNNTERVARVSYIPVH
jgi:putative endonuclease